MPSPQERARVRAQFHDLLISLRSGEMLARAEMAMDRARMARRHWFDRYEAEREAHEQVLADLVRA